VTTTHRTAGVSTAHASAPKTGSAATTRSGVGRHRGTSQCRGNNDDRNAMQNRFPHGRYLFLFQVSTMSLGGLRQRKRAILSN
jgi:hypothetical protein